MAVQLESSEIEEPADSSGNADSSDESAEVNSNTPTPSVATADQNATGEDRFSGAPEASG